ncbi:MAG: DUF2065 domain-containing protein [Duodenibacillus sp.]|nr:DUF2065 domain-containing protein [Duodenibacillus sp.]
MKVIILAFGFMAMFEGLAPLLFPEQWQRALKGIAGLAPEQVRRLAAALILAGLALVWGVWAAE